MPKVTHTFTYDDLEYQGGAEGGWEVEGTETREFTVNGQAYRTYLSAKNAKEFDEDQARWTQFAEKVTPATRARAPRAATSSGASRPPRSETAKIRAWAQTQNFDQPVSDKGRIPDKITDAYYATFPEERPAS